MADASLPPAYFQALYAGDSDPWRFETSGYEQEKYAATLAALPAPRFTRALEIGCSIGVLTAQLAQRCDALVSVDVADAALTQARARCAGLPVMFARAAVPAEWPMDQYDLIVFSEVLYYLSDADLARTAALACRDLRVGGTAILVHFTEPTNYPLSGDAAAEAFIRLTQPRLHVAQAMRAERYRLDVLSA